MDPGHMPFPPLIYAYRPIETLLHLRNTATLTLVEREGFLEPEKISKPCREHQAGTKYLKRLTAAELPGQGGPELMKFRD